MPFYRPENASRWRPRFLSFFPADLCRRVWISLDYEADYRLIKQAYEALVDTAPLFGARPLKRFLQRNVETKLARSLISGELGEGSDVTFTVQHDELMPVDPAAG